jgi:hypothetical protein
VVQAQNVEAKGDASSNVGEEKSEHKISRIVDMYEPEREVDEEGEEGEDKEEKEEEGSSEDGQVAGLEGQTDDSGSDSDDDSSSGDGDNEIRVTIGDESEEENEDPAPEWVNNLRRIYRLKEEENKKLKKELAEIRGTTEKKPAPLGPKPTIEKCLEELDYDDEAYKVYEERLDQWYKVKREHETAAEKEKLAAEKKQKELQGVIEEYQESKAKLAKSVGGAVEEAEAVFAEIFNDTQQGLILDGATDKGTVVYALGKNPKRAKALAAIKSPAKFCAELGRIEAQMKVTKRKPRTAPEPVVKSGTAKAVGGATQKLEQLREKAEKDGDATAAIRLRRELERKKG